MSALKSWLHWNTKRNLYSKALQPKRFITPGYLFGKVSLFIRPRDLFTSSFCYVIYSCLRVQRSHTITTQTSHNQEVCSISWHRLHKCSRVINTCKKTRNYGNLLKMERAKRRFKTRFRVFVTMFFPSSFWGSFIEANCWPR